MQTFFEAGEVWLKILMSDLSEENVPRFLVNLKAIRASKGQL